MERSRWILSIAAVAMSLALALIWQAAQWQAAPSPPPASRSLEPDDFIAATFMQCDEVCGQAQGIVFGDGSGYVFDMYPPVPGGGYGYSQAVRVQLGAGELDDLIDSFENNGFFAIDELMANPDTYHGPVLTLAYAERGGRHEAANRLVRHPPFLSVANHFKRLLERQAGDGRVLNTFEFLDAAAAHVESLPAGSEERRIIAEMYDGFIMHQDMRPPPNPERLARWQAARGW